MKANVIYDTIISRALNDYFVRSSAYFQIERAYFRIYADLLFTG